MTRPLGMEFVQLEQPNAAVIEETAPVAVARAEVVQVGSWIGEQVFGEQPDGVGGLEVARRRAWR